MKKLFSTIILTLIGTFVFSQSISVTSFRCLEEDLNARTSKVKDMNGELCALLILNTIEKGFEFSVCNIEKTEQKIGEIWLFISPGSRFITIKHREFGTIRNYPFPQSIEGGKTYEMKLKTVRAIQPVLQEEVKQYLVISSPTPNAKIFINDEFKGKNNAQAYLPIGVEHFYRIEAPLYHKKLGSVVLTEESKTTVTEELEPAFGYLNIVSSPENGAEIEINGELQSEKTPFKTQALASGTYTIQAFLPNYTSQPIQVEVEDGKTIDVNVPMIANFSIANIVCTDEDAEIYIDEEFKAVGKWSGVLSAGSHRLIARKGNNTHTENIEIVKGEDYSVTIPEIGVVSGKLNINSNPMDAEIYVDGKYYGTTPLLIPKMAVGTYKIELKKPGYNSVVRKNVVIKEDKTTDLNVELLKGNILRVAGETKGDKIYIDDKLVGNSPLSVNLDFGVHHVKIETPTCSGEYSITIKEGEPQNMKYYFSHSAMQLRATLKGHDDDVYMAAYSPDGSRIASASEDRTIKIWDVSSGECIKTLTGHTSDVFSVNWNSAGTKLVSASWDHTARIWDVATGDCEKILSRHSNAVSYAVFSPKGDRIASASWDKTIVLWDAKTGDYITTLYGHTAPVTSVNFDPNSKRLVSSSRDKKMIIWNAEGAYQIANCSGHRKDVYYTEFNFDGTKFLSCSDDKSIKVWESESLKYVNNFEEHSHYVNSAVFSPDGNFVATASSDRTIRIWDLNKEKRVKALGGHKNWVNSVRYHPNGNALVTASDDNTIKIWSSGEGIVIEEVSEIDEYFEDENF